MLGLIPRCSASNENKFRFDTSVALLRGYSLSNAIKYSPKGKLVTIAIEVAENNLTLCVKDDGMGIDNDDLNLLFDRYYRVVANETQHIAGFGIGLYLSAEIIQRHQGKIWAESEIGKGSTFSFTVPLGN